MSVEKHSRASIETQCDGCELSPIIRRLVARVEVIVMQAALSLGDIKSYSETQVIEIHSKNSVSDNQ